MTVLLWGAAEDAVVASVRDAVGRTGAEVLVTDGSDVSFIDVGRERITASGVTWNLAEVTGVLVRPPGTGEPRIYGALAAWTETTSAIALNRLSAGASNRSKPYQLRLLREAGFNVPDTIVTTDPADVRAFAAEHGQIIYKSTSGVRSIVKLFDVADEDRLDRLEACPTQFQQYVAGVDHRVHVVGEDLFATLIETAATDYRYASLDGKGVVMKSVTLPAPIAALCRSITRDMGLTLAGIDLRVEANGCWSCFEVNTSPGFIWFEQQTGQPIAAAIARLLTRAD